MEIEKDGSTYKINGESYTRVTNVVGQLFPGFNEEVQINKILETKSEKYKDMTYEDIKQQWSNTRESAAQLGTELHDYIEFFLRGEPKKKPKTLRKECNQFHQFIENFCNEYPEFSSKVEYTIYDPRVKIAGTVDCLIYDGEKYHLYDWKRTKDLYSYYGKYGTHNITEKLTANNYHKYSTQLAIYAKILRDNYDIDVGQRIYLVVFNAEKNSYERVQTRDLTENINKLFEELASSH